ALLVVVLLVRLGGWLLPAVIAAVLLMVVGHELGHFVTAKWTGMKATEFFVGFGPRIWSFRRGETEYGIKALPLGGYVKITGMSSLEQLDDGDEPRSYRAQSYPRRLLVASAGSIMHVIMAALLLLVSYSALGVPDSSKIQIAGFTTWDGHAKTVAQLAGMHRGDEVERVTNLTTGRVTTVRGGADLIGAVAASSNQPLELVVRRDGQIRTVTATPVDGRTLRSGGVELVAPSQPAHGFLGISLENPNKRVAPWTAVPTVVTRVGSMIKDATLSVPKMFSPSQLGNLFQNVTNNSVGQQSAQTGNRPVSGVGAVRLAVESAHAGPREFIALFATLNIFVGVLNMFPMMPLDGGLVLVATYERLRTRKGHPRYQADLNRLAPAIFLFLGLLAFIFLTTLYLDIVHPINNPFQ
ncbi:MAG: site-2 protease family protein, partial [Actinomycetes bacterium]